MPVTWLKMYITYSYVYINLYSLAYFYEQKEANPFASIVTVIGEVKNVLLTMNCKHGLFRKMDRPSYSIWSCAQGVAMVCAPLCLLSVVRCLLYREMNIRWRSIEKFFF